MSKAISLLNLQQEHLGFMLLADVPNNYTSNPGQWNGDCVFVGTPRKVHLFDDPGFIAIADHQALGEHRVTIINDGSAVSFHAVSSDKTVIYLAIPLLGLGEWGVAKEDLQFKLGHTQFAPQSQPTK